MLKQVLVKHNMTHVEHIIFIYFILFVYLLVVCKYVTTFTGEKYKINLEFSVFKMI